MNPGRSFKRTLLVAACVLALVSVIFPALQCRSSAEERQPEDLRLKSMEGLMERLSASAAASLPSLRAFLQILGMPDESVVADDEYCILGQLHRWCIPEQNLNILVIGGTYDPEIDYSVESRAIGLRKCSQGLETPFQGPWGIRPGDTDRVVKEKLEQCVSSDAGSILMQNSHTAAIHGFLNGLDMTHQYIVKKDGLYFYFMMNKSGLLEVILVSRIDLLRFC